MIPELGFTTLAKTERVIDADTIEVSITRKIKVRLLGVNAPELSTEEGKFFKEVMQNLLKDSDNITLFIPSKNPDKLMDFNTFDRVVGTIWLKNGEKLNDLINGEINK